VCCLLAPPSGWLSADDRSKVENSLGFRTAGEAKHFRAFWESVKDEHRMKGDVSDHLTAGQIDSVVVLEVTIAIAEGPGRSVSWANWLLGNRQSL
jgi:hypothetical protein